MRHSSDMRRYSSLKRTGALRQKMQNVLGPLPCKRFLRRHVQAYGVSLHHRRSYLMPVSKISHYSFLSYTVDDKLMTVLYPESGTATIYSFISNPKIIEL